jgi:LacI family gluconate utilization system Gnt-I transcriptional repressor
LKSGRAALADLLAANPSLDAVFCSSDLLALGVLTEARVRGVRVPEQLAVVGFGDQEFAADLDPALTTVHIDGGAIGRQAAQFICERAEGRAVEPRIVDIGFSIVERAST